MPRIHLYIPLLFVLVGCTQAKKEEATDGERLTLLQEQVEDQRRKSEDAVESYAPKVVGQIGDLGVSAADILRQLPGVADVEVLVASERPTHRIVHLRDWHYVPKDLYALDLRSTAKRSLSDEEIDRLHEEHLLEVELVQLEQVALLRCLVKHHGLRRVHSEGLTPPMMEAYKAKVAALKKLGEQLGGLRAQLQEVPAEKRADVDYGVEALANEYRLGLLELGAPGRLAMSVLPLDDEKLLDQAKPITPDGRVKFDPQKVEARHDGQVKAALESGPLSLLILGSDHDLSASVRKIGSGEVEYIRVTTTRYREISSAGR